MASDVVGLLDALNVSAFHLSGHDRGGRVAHRLALDHPDRVLRLSVLDIAPTLDMYNATDMAFAQAYYHWFHLTQPAPLPETMIAGNPLAYLHAKLGGWGSAGLGHIEPEALAEYERCFTHPTLAANGLPAAIHTACEDYRAGASIDLVHERASRAHGDKVTCPLHVLWGAQGVVHRLFDPMALWQAQCSGPLSGRAMACGHFIPEALPNETATELLAFHG
jgi:haloacetate dehalogenase